jgi:hypothetical protein
MHRKVSQFRAKPAGRMHPLKKSHLPSRRQRFRLSSHTVADELTGAVWSRDANPAEYPLTWNEAMAFVADMRARQVHGYDNWQLPSRDLLFSLISHQNVNPALPDDHPFDNVFTGYYWTVDSCSRLPDQAWYVHLGGGRVHRGMKHGSYMVWPISPGNQNRSILVPMGRRALQLLTMPPSMTRTRV